MRFLAVLPLLLGSSVQALHDSNFLARLKAAAVANGLLPVGAANATPAEQSAASARMALPQLSAVQAPQQQAGQFAQAPQQQAAQLAQAYGQAPRQQAAQFAQVPYQTSQFAQAPLQGQAPLQVQTQALDSNAEIRSLNDYTQMMQQKAALQQEMAQAQLPAQAPAALAETPARSMPEQLWYEQHMPVQMAAAAQDTSKVAAFTQTEYEAEKPHHKKAEASALEKVEVEQTTKANASEVMDAFSQFESGLTDLAYQQKSSAYLQPMVLEQMSAGFLQQNAALEQSNAALERRNAALEQTNADLETRYAALQKQDATLQYTAEELQKKAAEIQRTYTEFAHEVQSKASVDLVQYKQNASEEISHLIEVEQADRQEILTLSTANKGLIEKVGSLEQVVSSVRQVIKVLKAEGDSSRAASAALLAADHKKSSHLETASATAPAAEVVPLGRAIRANEIAAAPVQAHAAAATPAAEDRSDDKTVAAWQQQIGQQSAIPQLDQSLDTSLPVVLPSSAAQQPVPAVQLTQEQQLQADLQLLGLHTPTQAAPQASQAAPAGQMQQSQLMQYQQLLRQLQQMQQTPQAGQAPQMQAMQQQQQWQPLQQTPQQIADLRR